LTLLKKRRIFMKKLISVKLAGNIVIVLMVLMIILHMLIMLRIVPYDIVWGGQIKNDASLMLSLIHISEPTRPY